MLLFHYRPGGLTVSLTDILLAMLLVLVPVVSFCQEPVETQAYTVIGSSSVIKADIEKSRQLAIENGQVIAMSLAAGDLLPVEVRVKHFKTINSILYDRRDSFIDGYRVLTEGRFNKAYRVLAEVTVAVRRLKNELLSTGILSAGKTLLPSVLLLISEQNLEDLSPRYWWHAPGELQRTHSEETMKQVFVQRGFSVLDPATVLSEHPDAMIADQPDLTDAQVADIGRQLQADVVIVGRALVEVAANTMGAEIRTFKATLSVRAILVPDVESIGDISRSAMAINADRFVGARMALSSAATLTAEDLAGQLTTVWGTRQAQASSVKIIVQGTANLGNFVNFRRVLSSLPGVKQVQIQNLAADSATLEVTWKGDARSLADTLIRQTFAGFGLSIGEVTPGSLQVRLNPAASAAEQSQ